MRATYRWEVLDKGYNFDSDLIAIGGLHTKLCAHKVMGISVVGISGLPIGSARTKGHLDAAHVENYREYYKGEGGDFPQVRVVVSFVSLKLHVVRLNTKSAQTMH
jgi:hypothetical protein